MLAEPTMPQRQDYILRLIDELREFVNAILQGGHPERGKEALHAVVHAQQQLFQRPPAEFLGHDLTGQIDLLARGESPAGAAEKVATYAEILVEAARAYDGLQRSPLTASSRQLALAVLLEGALRWPDQREVFEAPMAGLLAEIPIADLNPPVREMLDRFKATTTG